jgi:hypothetical protein
LKVVVIEGWRQSSWICLKLSVTRSKSSYGSPSKYRSDSLHERLADRLEEAIQVSRAGRMRDDGWTNVVELGA